MPLGLTLFLVINVAGCTEQQQKSKETGEAIIGIVKGMRNDSGFIMIQDI